jgi:N-acetylmuramoyl-L-alanine amidase
MVEMGRRFDDNKILRGAIEQYRFLRKEYPGSKYRFEALFTIGEIYKDDLNDPEEARATFEDFLQRYPHNRLADDARAAVKEINAASVAMERSADKAARKQRSSGNSTGKVSAGANAANSDDADSLHAESARRSALPRVTGVRHWSTPDYTRVAIDVEQEVKFGSQRISHPDRIFFDLHDTRLASTLVGKSFDVDDGFLKTIRVAESQPGRTRIVLEVEDLASYEAFLLPDPYRLIIDIHGKDISGKQKRATPTVNAETAGGSVSKQGLVETDLPAGGIGTDAAPSGSARPTTGNGVTKTTVAVKGSNRRIPKTIVDADTSADSHDADNEADYHDGQTTQADNHEAVNREALNRTPATVAAIEKPRSLTEGVGASKSDASASPSPYSQHRKKSQSAPPAAVPDTADFHLDTPESREARPTAAGDRSLTRALGLKIGKIVIDAGHGGYDTGTIGPNGLLEKDVVLDVAKRLGRLLEARLGAEVIYTRRDDTFIPLETRTAIANRERADLFISIHANSSRNSDARGVETYYLNFTSSPDALEVAARENAVSEQSIHQLQDLVKKIALKDKIDESREFAGDVQESLYGALSLNSAGVRDRGVKKAPFIVLIGANMPSILAEISFVSNPTDERKLETAEHRQRIAESLYRGVSKYVNGLSGVKVASKIDKHEGQ